MAAEEQLIILQAVAAIFALFALSRVYVRFTERKLSSFSFLFWVAVWVFGVLFILFPEITTRFAQLVGIGRGVDVVIYASIAVLFYLIFRIYIKVEETQRQITEVARKIALQDDNQKQPTRKHAAK